MRPQGKSDLQIMWALRDISSDILDFNQKGFLLILLSIIGNKEFCSYSFPEMVEIFGCSERHLRNIINSLESIGYLIVNRPAKKGRHHNNKYYLNYDLILNINKAQYAVLNAGEIRHSVPYLEPEIRHKSEINKAQFADPYKDNKQEKERERGKTAILSIEDVQNFIPSEIAQNECRARNIDVHNLTIKFKSRLCARGTFREIENLDAEFFGWIMKEKIN